MKKIFALLLTGCLGLFSQASYAQEDLSVFGYWTYYDGVPSASLYKHLVKRSSGQLDTRAAAIAKLKTKADWEQRQVAMRKVLSNAVGAFPERTPLNAVVTGVVKRADFTVEKLYFESRPGYHVTAALFIPQVRPAKSPAIVYCSGHSANGFRSSVYQNIILNYVKKGFIVLAFDPIGQGERGQYTQDPSKINAVDEHSYAGTQSFISGMPPANYFIWDGIRAVDYLVSRKEVDASRIGIAGRSGGGTQSAYIAAMDERILAAAPECYITTFDKLLHSKGPQDAEQNLMYGLEKGIDMADFLELRAPKPTLLVTTTRDMFSIQGARDVFGEAGKVYAAFGKRDNLRMVEDDAGHASTLKNREASYAFFQKFLNNPGSSKEVEVEIFSDTALYVTPHGNIHTWLNGETMFSLNEKFTRKVVENRTHRRAAEPGELKNLREKIISLTGYESPSARKEIIFSGRLQRKEYAIEKYLLKGAGDYYLPVLWLKANKPASQTIMLLHEEGKTKAASPGGIADQLALRGYDVVMPDLSGFGELGPGYMKSGDSEIDGVFLNLWYTGILTHKSLVAVRVGEIEIVADFIKSKLQKQTHLVAAAWGTLTSDLFHAAAIRTGAFDKLVYMNPLISYESIALSRHYTTKYALSSVAGALPFYDIADLVALSPQPMLILNPVDAESKPVEPDRAKRIYTTPSGRSAIDLPVIQCNVPAMNLSSSIHDWLK